VKAETNSTVEDYFLMRYVGSFDHCHRRDLVAYTLSSTADDNRTLIQQVVLRNLADGSESIISAGGQKEREPRFSPDGSQICFLSDASGTSQLHLADLTSGNVARITSLRLGVSNPVWAPGGDRIAFVSSFEAGGEPSSAQEQPSDTGRNEFANRPAEPVIVEDFGYKSDEAMTFTRKETSHIWLIVPGESEPRILTDGDRDHVMPVWSPDGEYVVFTSNRCRPREESIGMDLFRVPAGGGDIERLTEDGWIAYYPAPFQPLFTPNGGKIVFGALAPSLEGGIPRTLLYSMPAGGGEATLLFPADAPCHEATCFMYNAENLGAAGANARISSDGSELYFISGWHGSADLYGAALEGDPRIRRITTGKHAYRAMGPALDGRMMVLKGDFLHTPQLFLRDEVTGDEVAVTDSNPWCSQRAMNEPEEFWFNTLDGDGRIHGWVLPPQNRLPDRKYPAVLYIHGGPTPFYGYGLTYEHQAIAGAGIAVIFCNPRGSSGYGEKHQNMAQAFDGTAMYDLLQCVEEAVNRYGWIDPDRIGVAGASYGGYMTNWIVTHSRRFKAAVTQRAVANAQIQYASSDMAGSSREFESFRDFIVDNVRKSAVAYAERIEIPLLILHSTGDMRCPVEQAHQLFVAVKDTHPDLPVRLVLFPRSNHSLTINGPMDLRVAHYRELVQWFEKHL